MPTEIQQVLLSAGAQIDMVLADINGNAAAGRILRSAENKAALTSIRDRLFLHASQQEQDASPPPGQRSAVIELIVKSGAQGRRDALAHLRDWLKGGEHVMLCDPYLLAKQSRSTFASDEAYVEALVRLLPRSAKRVDVFCNSFARPIKEAFRRQAKEGRMLRIFNTHEIHDRFVVRDGAVKGLGGSIGGFGAKFSVIFDLEGQDARDVVAELGRLQKKP